jgi:hypothetical protein
MAPQAILELVDGKRDMQWCMTARKVARSQILGTKWLSESTKGAMYQLLQFRGEKGIEEFDEEVARQKNLLMREDKVHGALLRSKQNKTIRDIEDRVDERALYSSSRTNRKHMKEMEERMREKQRRDAYISEAEIKADQEKKLAALRGEKPREDGSTPPPLEEMKGALRKQRTRGTRSDGQRGPIDEGDKTSTQEKQSTDN